MDHWYILQIILDIYLCGFVIFYIVSYRKKEFELLQKQRLREEAETKKIPYMCITGDKEVENSTISIRKRRKGDLGDITLPEFTKKIKYEIKRRVNN